MLFKILKVPFIVLHDLLQLFIVYMPGIFGTKIRYLYYKKKLKKCGKNVIIDIGVHIEGAELISIGDDVFIDKYCIISTGKKLTGDITRKSNELFQGNFGEVFIGNNIHIAQFCILMGYGGLIIADNCVLSSGCKIYSLTNTAYDVENKQKKISIMPYSQAPFFLSPVVFERNTWLGLNTVVMPSVSIGKDSFCSTNSIVMNSFEENSYISGQPAKKVKSRFSSKAE